MIRDGDRGRLESGTHLKSVYSSILSSSATVVRCNSVGRVPALKQEVVGSSPTTMQGIEKADGSL